MEQTNRDQLIAIALLLELDDLLRLCQSSKRINRIICDNDDFWKRKLLVDYDIQAHEVPTDRSYKDFYKFVTESDSLSGLMKLRKIKILQRDIKRFTKNQIKVTLNMAVNMGWQEGIEFLLDNGADISFIRDTTMMDSLYPGYGRKCQQYNKTLPIVPGSDEFWTNRGHKILEHDGSKFICINKDQTPFVKTNGVPCCRNN